MSSSLISILRRFPPGTSIASRGADGHVCLKKAADDITDLKRRHGFEQSERNNSIRMTACNTVRDGGGRGNKHGRTEDKHFEAQSENKSRDGSNYEKKCHDATPFQMAA